MRISMYFVTDHMIGKNFLIPMDYREESQSAILGYAANTVEGCRYKTLNAFEEFRESVMQTRTRQIKFERLKEDFDEATIAMKYWNHALSNTALDSGLSNGPIPLEDPRGTGSSRLYHSGLSSSVSCHFLTHTRPLRAAPRCWHSPTRQGLQDIPPERLIVGQYLF